MRLRHVLAKGVRIVDVPYLLRGQCPVVDRHFVYSSGEAGDARVEAPARTDRERPGRWLIHESAKAALPGHLRAIDVEPLCRPVESDRDVRPLVEGNGGWRVQDEVAS